MDLLFVPVPFFTKELTVDSYYVRHQKGNDLLDAGRSRSTFDGATFSPLLEALNIVGLDAFTMGKPIFVPVHHLMLLGGLDRQCLLPPDQVIFVIDGEVRPEEPYLSRMERLRGLGFRFAIQKITGLTEFAPVLALCDFIFLSAKEPEQLCLLTQLKASKLSVVITHIDTNEIFGGMSGSAKLFEGRFYRTPVTRGKKLEVSPLKANMLRLLNLVQDENFEFVSVAEILQRDTALSVSLLRLVNSPFIGLRNKVNDLQHAVTILGQEEVRRWATTAVSRLLGADKPDEVMKLSLTRAKFAENLAPWFGLQKEEKGLFLMGLFSVLDVILDMTMERAMELVLVSDSIRDALVSLEGPYSGVMEFIYQYEQSAWSTISRMMILHDMEPGDVYECYMSAAVWYRNLINETSPKAVR